MQKIFLFSLILMIFSGSARAEDTAVRDLTLAFATAVTGPLAFCAYKAACGSKSAKKTLKFSAYALSLCGTFGTAMFGVANPNLSPLKRSCCAVGVVLFGISTCVSAEMFADELKSYAETTEVEGEKS